MYISTLVDLKQVQITSHGSNNTVLKVHRKVCDKSCTCVVLYPNHVSVQINV